VGGNGETKPRSKEEVLAEIARAREQITWSAQALRSEVATRMDWRAHVRRRPWAFLAGAAAVGFVLGLRRK